MQAYFESRTRDRFVSPEEEVGQAGLEGADSYEENPTGRGSEVVESYCASDETPLGPDGQREMTPVEAGERSEALRFDLSRVEIQPDGSIAAVAEEAIQEEPITSRVATGSFAPAMTGRLFLGGTAMNLGIVAASHGATYLYTRYVNPHASIAARVIVGASPIFGFVGFQVLTGTPFVVAAGSVFPGIASFYAMNTGARFVLENGSRLGMQALYQQIVDPELGRALTQSRAMSSLPQNGLSMLIGMGFDRCVQGIVGESFIRSACAEGVSDMFENWGCEIFRISDRDTRPFWVRFTGSMLGGFGFEGMMHGVHVGGSYLFPSHANTINGMMAVEQGRSTAEHALGRCAMGDGRWAHIEYLKLVILGPLKFVILGLDPRIQSSLPPPQPSPQVGGNTNPRGKIL